MLPRQGLVVFSPLEATCGNGHAYVARLLLQQIPCDSPDGVTALRSAAIHNHRDMTQLLMVNSVQAKSEKCLGTSVFMQAGMAGHLEVATMLVVQGADVEARLASAQKNLVAKRVRRTTEYTSTPCLQTCDAGHRPTRRNLVG